MQNRKNIANEWEMQEKIEKEWKHERKGGKREGKEKLKKKVKIILSLVLNKQKCGKTRRELHGAMPYNTDYKGLLIY